MEIAVILLLILINGFFALSEIALVSGKKSRLEALKNNGRKGAATALRLMDDSENFLSAIQVGITLIGIVTGVYGGVSIADNITPWFEQFQLLSAYASEIALTVTVFIITYLSIVVGELVPKTIALSNPENLAVVVAPVIYYFSKIFYPFVKLLSFSTYAINRILGIRKQSELITEEEIRHLLRSASHQGIIEHEQNVMHEKLFYFADKKAKHLMTHRTEVDWIDLNDDAAVIHQQMMSTPFSQLLVCKGDIDDFVGIIRVKDYLRSKGAPSREKVKGLIMDPLVIPENTGAQRIVTLFRQKRSYFAVVVNEFGGVEGIVTLHDIMENIVGEMPEQLESTDPDVFVRDDQSVLVSGDAALETLVGLLEHFSIDFDTIDYSTVAGFVINHLNDIPKVGDKFEYGNRLVEIVDVDGVKVDKILISQLRDSSK
jgi:putative hemolysin